MPSLYHPSFIPVRIRGARFFGEHVPAEVPATFTEKTPGRLRPGEGAQGGCFLGRKKDLFERFFPAATRRGAGIFCGAIFKEIRVLYTIEHLVHPRQWIAVNMMDRVKT